MTGHHRSSIITPILFILFFLFLSANVGFSQTDNDRNFARGFDPGQTYHDFGSEKVNILNGNLTVSIPIGPALNHNGGLGLQLNLHYNSKLWATEPKTISSQFMRVAYLEGRSTVGLGWKLHLGRIYRQPMSSSPRDEVYFESSEGNLHRLFPVNTSNPDSGYWYTKDNSYIRAFYYSASGEWKLWLPSGEVYTIDHYIAPNEDDYTTGEYCHQDPSGYHDCFRGHYTTRIEDRFGNAISVEYYSPTGSMYRCMQRIEFEGIDDGSVNKREIIFDAEAQYDFGSGNEDVEGGYIKRIKVPAVTQTGEFPANTATYELNYHSSTPYPIVKYPIGDSSHYSEFLNGCSNSLTFQKIMILESIYLPTGDEISFTYDELGAATAGAVYTTGELTDIYFPTGKHASYTYATYDFASTYTQPKGWSVDVNVRETRGVIERGVYDEDENLIENYSYERHILGSIESGNPFRVDVCSMHPSLEGSVNSYKTIMLYHTSTRIISSSPSTRDTITFVPEEGLCYEETVYYEDPSRNYCDAGDVAKTMLYEFEYDPLEHHGRSIYPNVRESKTTSVWPNPGGNPAEIEVSQAKTNYLGFGHYQYSAVKKGLQFLRIVEQDWEIEEDTNNDYYNKG